MKLEQDDIDRIVRTAVAQALAAHAAAEAQLSDQRLAIPEAEAAALLGLKASYVLRDMRRRGEIRGRKAGRVIVYDRQELLRWLREKD